MITKLTDSIDWIGVVDWGLKHFHGFELSTHRGSTYNSYLIRDDKTAVVDTVWAPFADEYLQQLAATVDLASIDYVIANHAEPDHSGALPRLMEHCPQATVVVSKRGAQSIPGHYHQDWRLQPVSTGDTIDLGTRKLVFVEAPMLHWPDSMFTYVTEDNVLMPNDAFGQHYATAFRFNDQVNQDELRQEAQKYYANILTPFSDRVSKKISELLDMNLPVNIIAPSHGVIWRQDPMQIVKLYQEWAAQKGDARAVILYDTMWNATRKMAEAVSEGLTEAGIDSKLFHMAVMDRNDAIAEIFKARAIVIGSPTLNNGVLPTIMPILEDLKGLKFKNKLGAAFGSYGWSGESVKLIEEHLETCELELAAAGVRAKWQPTLDDLQSCRNLGMQLSQRLQMET